MMPFSDLENFVSRIDYNVPLSKMTTFRVGGPADAVIYPRNIDEFRISVRYLTDKTIPFFMIGKGSNLLVGDRGYRGAVIKLDGKLTEFRFDGDYLFAGAGAGLIRASKEAGDRGLSGLEFAAGIPGTIGGALVMNAGAHGEEISGIAEEIHCLNSGGETEILSRNSINWGYRQGIGDSRCIFTTILKFSRSQVDIIKKKMDNNLKVRKHSQPEGFSAGSVFRNPETGKAWEWIEKAGFRGQSIGDAMVSGQHANFIVNRGKATATDIDRLIRMIRDKVFEFYGIELKTEIKRIGEFGE